LFGELFSLDFPRAKAQQAPALIVRGSRGALVFSEKQRLIPDIFNNTPLTPSARGSRIA